MRGKLNFGLFGVVALAAALNLCTTPLRAQSIEEKTAVCAGCHGADGKPVDKTIPNIWGQQAGYIYIELRDFKRGDRQSDIMQPPVCRTLRNDNDVVVSGPRLCATTW